MAEKTISRLILFFPLQLQLTEGEFTMAIIELQNKETMKLVSCAH